MKQLCLHESQREQLLVFCAGWGMDERPFRYLKSSEYDVLFLYDCDSLQADQELLDSISRYQRRLLLGWSMGVWWGRCLFGGLGLFEASIALNGTLCPIHDEYGIPRDLMTMTMEKWSVAARDKFYRRMCQRRDILERFLADMPQRSIEGQRQELRYYLDAELEFDVSDDFYSDVIVADRDFVVPSENQRRFWRERSIREVSGAHFPFYSWASWDGMLDTLLGRSSVE
ncbi:MAG: hypothetical protein CSA62_10585 [Planctomycetota bacterium]|nr:MAG: hypothetical protein CSA62_10585 [Planctomycetota bacterium]